MNFNLWEHIGTIIGGIAVAIVGAMVGFGKGAAHLSKDLASAKESRDTGRLYDRQYLEIKECKEEIKVLKKEHAKCEERLDEQEHLISQLNLRIIDLQNQF